MQRNPQLWITTGIALVGASLITVTPVTTPRPDVQHRQFRLTDYDEFDLSQLTTTTEANWSGLETVLSSSNWLTDPDISQGLSTVLSDLSTGTSNPVTNPIALLTEGALLLTSSGDASNAASTALTAVTDNVESALSSGDYSTALTDLENGPTTVLDAFLNGYPETVGSGLISPESGMLTNTTDGAATGQIDALQQLSNTIADELSAVGGGNVTTTPTLLEPGSLDISVNVSTILNDLAPSGSVTLPVSLDSLLSDAAPSGTLTLPVTLDSLLSDAAPGGTITLPFSLNDLLAGAAPGGTVTLPISLDGLLIDAAGSSGNITIPITPDQVLGDALGNGGSSLSVSLNEESILSDVVGSGISVPVTVPIINKTEDVTVSLTTIGIGPRAQQLQRHKRQHSGQHRPQRPRVGAWQLRQPGHHRLRQQSRESARHCRQLGHQRVHQHPRAASRHLRHLGHHPLRLRLADTSRQRRQPGHQPVGQHP